MTGMNTAEHRQIPDWQLIWQLSQDTLGHAGTLCGTNASEHRIRGTRPSTPWHVLARSVNLLLIPRFRVRLPARAPSCCASSAAGRQNAFGWCVTHFGWWSQLLRLIVSTIMLCKFGCWATKRLRLMCHTLRLMGHSYFGWLSSC